MIDVSKPTIHTMPQGSDEWFQVKLGKVSASHMHEVMANGKGGASSVTRKKYMYKLAAERLTGKPQASFSNEAMVNGIDIEPMAREAYEFTTLTVVDQVGFVEINDYLGCSPDGLVESDGMTQFKCPLSSTHIKYIDENRMISDYNRQVNSEMWMCSKEWSDLVSYDPDNASCPLWKIRVFRDEELIRQIAIETELFIEELKELVAKIRSKG